MMIIIIIIIIIIIKLTSLEITKMIEGRKDLGRPVNFFYSELKMKILKKLKN